MIEKSYLRTSLYLHHLFRCRLFNIFLSLSIHSLLCALFISRIYFFFHTCPFLLWLKKHTHTRVGWRQRLLPFSLDLLWHHYRRRPTLHIIVVSYGGATEKKKE